MYERVTELFAGHPTYKGDRLKQRRDKLLRQHRVELPGLFDLRCLSQKTEMAQQTADNKPTTDK